MTMPLWTGFLVVFLGSGIGGMLRHGVGLLALRFTGANFPWGTLVINVVGSALMGLMIGLFAARSINDPELRLFVTTGLIGGFTTWSTFSLDIVTLWERRDRLCHCLCRCQHRAVVDGPGNRPSRRAARG
jgi:CrcB protein